MKNITFYAFVSVVFVLFAVGAVSAQYNVGDVNVQISPGSVKVNDTNVQLDSGSVKVNDINVQNTGGGLKVNVPGTEVQVGSSGTIRVGDVNVKLSDGALDVQLERGTLGVSAKEAIVNLEGGADVLIQTDDDLVAYQNLVVETRPSIRAVQVSNGKVSVAYRQPGRFLGIFRTNLQAKAELDESGTVKVNLPWYSFLFSKNSSEVESELRVQISNADGKEVQVSGLGSGNTTVRVKNSAHAVNIMTSVIDGKTSVNISR